MSSPGPSILTCKLGVATRTTAPCLRPAYWDDPPDLVVLAADKDMEHALRGLLSRHKSLATRQAAFDIFVHPQHDVACATRVGVPSFPRFPSDTNALLILDHEGGGRETRTQDDLQAALNQEFRASAWGRAGQGNRPGPGAGDLGLE